MEMTTMSDAGVKKWSSMKMLKSLKIVFIVEPTAINSNEVN